MRGNPELQGNPSGTVTSVTEHALCPYMGFSLISKYLRMVRAPGMCRGQTEDARRGPGELGASL